MQFTLHKELWNILIYLPFSTWCGKFLAASLSSVSICVVAAPLVFLGTGGFDSPPLAGTGGGTARPPPMTVVPAPTATSSYDCVTLCFGTMVLISAYSTVASDCIGFTTPPLGTWPKSEYIGSLVAPIAPIAPVAPVAPVGPVGLVSVVGCSSVDDCSRRVVINIISNF